MKQIYNLYRSHTQSIQFIFIFNSWFMTKGNTNLVIKSTLLTLTVSYVIYYLDQGNIARSANLTVLAPNRPSVKHNGDTGIDIAIQISI